MTTSRRGEATELRSCLHLQAGNSNRVGPEPFISVISASGRRLDQMMMAGLRRSFQVRNNGVGESRVVAWCLESCTPTFRCRLTHLPGHALFACAARLQLSTRAWLHVDRFGRPAAEDEDPLKPTDHTTFKGW